MLYTPPGPASSVGSPFRANVAKKLAGSGQFSTSYVVFYRFALFIDYTLNYIIKIPDAYTAPLGVVSRARLCVCVWGGGRGGKKSADWSLFSTHFP